MRIAVGPSLPAVTQSVSFERPPVIETLCSVQFAPIPGFDLAHFGLFWGEIRDEYPRQEIKPALAPAVEDFPLPAGERGPRLEISSEPSARVWFVTSARTELVQLQRDRFTRNWRKTAATDIYPRYEQLRPRFERDWRRFLDFLKREGLSAPDITQCEVTYINHIELGAGSFGDPSPVLRIIAQPGETEFLPRPEMVMVNVTYSMPEARGRLHVAAQPGIRLHDQREILQLTLTARGKPTSSDYDALIDWLDEGHDWIVKGFVDITTAKMQETVWRRT